MCGLILSTCAENIKHQRKFQSRLNIYGNSHMAMYLDTWTCAVNMDMCGVPRTWPCSPHMSMFTTHVHVHRTCTSTHGHVHHTCTCSRHMTTFSTVSSHSRTFSPFVLSQSSLTLSSFHPLV